LKVVKKLEDINVKRIISYLGSKVNLFPFIKKVILDDIENEDKKVFIDLFSGTCSVSRMIDEITDLDLVVNDLSLYSEILGVELELKNIDQSNFNDFKELLKELDNNNNISNGIFFNEFSMGGIPKTVTDSTLLSNQKEYPFSRMFFKKEVGQKIDSIRENIRSKNISPVVVKLVILFLLNYASKNANTSAVYGAYLKYDKFKNREIPPFFDTSLLDYLEKKVNKNNNKKNIYIYSDFAEKTLDHLIENNIISNRTIREKKTKYNIDNVIIYWDPPYNSRSYEGNYHILEYLSDLTFDPVNTIKLNSKTGMKKTENKRNSPFSSKIKTPKIFKELIKKSMMSSNVMYISYSNEGLMKEEDILKILDELSKEEQYFTLELETFKEKYKKFTSGENNGVNNGEKNNVFEIIWKIKNKQEEIN